MYTIHLHDLLIEAKHGLYPEEKIIGGPFLVSIDISFPSHYHVQSIEDTINYVSVFELLSLKMSTPTELLEVLAKEITTEIYNLNNKIVAIKICIKKMQPPINHFIGNVGVSLETSF